VELSRTVAGAIAKTLHGMGARYCFGVMGTANYKISYALQELGVRIIAARHEGNAATMADAYSKATGELTLLSMHSGPGLTNALTGIGEAAKSKTPMVILAGDVPRGNTTNNFHFDQAAMAQSVGAIAERIHTPHTALADTVRAVTRAMRDRQTVLLSLPTDVQDSGMPSEVVAPQVTDKVEPSAPNAIAVGRLADKLASAQRPLIIAGRGAVISGAEHSLEMLAELAGALLATTVCGHGFFKHNPFSIGISGGFSSDTAAKLIEESDLLIGFGASFTKWTTKNGKLIKPGTAVAQVDIDAARLGFQRPLDFAIQGDAKATADALIASLRTRGTKKTGRRTEVVKKQISAGTFHNEIYDDQSTEEYIDPRTVSKAVDKILPESRTVASDAGHFMAWVPSYFRVPDARASCLPFSFQSVGLGMGSAIGLALSQPNRLSVLTTGDGGFYMSLADLETAVRLALNMCIFVYDDAAYGAEVHHFRRLGLDIELARFPPTDIAAAARGLGAQAITVRSLADLAPLEKWVADGAKGVFLVDAKINPDFEANWHKEYASYAH
jgi:thiamine pyrophosphate-dependent acetolactate synthase large subunit-like protein